MHLCCCCGHVPAGSVSLSSAVILSLAPPSYSAWHHHLTQPGTTVQHICCTRVQVNYHDCTEGMCRTTHDGQQWLHTVSGRDPLWHHICVMSSEHWIEGFILSLTEVYSNVLFCANTILVWRRSSRLYSKSERSPLSYLVLCWHSSLKMELKAVCHGSTFQLYFVLITYSIKTQFRDNRLKEDFRIKSYVLFRMEPSSLLTPKDMAIVWVTAKKLYFIMAVNTNIF